MNEAPQNIDTHEKIAEALAGRRLGPGSRIHIGVCGLGQTTEDAFFEEYRHADRVMIVRLGNHRHELAWGDIIELWPVSLPGKEQFADGA